MEQLKIRAYNPSDKPELIKLLKHRIELLQSIKNVENIKVRRSRFAYKFYEKNGFVLKSITKDYWAKGFDLYDMRYEHKHAGL